AEAVAAAQDAELAVLAVGDLAGLFGAGTSGEGCDVESLQLPGAQHDLVEAVLATGTPVVLLLVTGRPYSLGAYRGRRSEERRVGKEGRERGAREQGEDGE